LIFADAIVDWRSTNGSGNYALNYASLGYLDKNSPFETMDELRLVYGATIDLLVGEDVNRNGVLDTNEKDLNGNARWTRACLNTSPFTAAAEYPLRRLVADEREPGDRNPIADAFPERRRWQREWPGHFRFTTILTLAMAGQTHSRVF